FSRKQAIEPKIINLNNIVKSIEPILRRLIRQDVELRLHLDKDLGSIKADSSQIEQVILNLAVNARDAMPQGGTLSIETTNAELDAGYVSTYPDILPGEYVMLSIADNGIGMDKETQLHIFEPFFTTKESGRGTGLGLATVFGNVKQSAGHITVYSEMEKGTTFRIYLPREFHGSALEVDGTRSPLPLVAGNTTVLLVDDNDVVRRALAGLLELHNFKVLEAGDGQKALKLLEEEKELINILITDMMMPKMSGTDLAARARSFHPELSVLYMSGYSEHMVSFQADARTSFLTKPAPIQKILQKISELVKAATV
ncbi:ATP-binding protein, partial [bacterium]|nr:ATP-binding protein [bacterium]